MPTPPSNLPFEPVSVLPPVPPPAPVVPPPPPAPSAEPAIRAMPAMPVGGADTEDIFAKLDTPKAPPSGQAAPILPPPPVRQGSRTLTIALAIICLLAIIGVVIWYFLLRPAATVQTTPVDTGKTLPTGGSVPTLQVQGDGDEEQDLVNGEPVATTTNANNGEVEVRYQPGDIQVVSSTEENPLLPLNEIPVTRTEPPTFLPVTTTPPNPRIPTPIPSLPTTTAAVTTTSPLSASVDTDKDGLSDVREVELGTDPVKADTDADGATDGDEVLKLGTNPLNPDTDGDGFKDGVEIGNGYNPRGPGKCSKPGCEL